MRPVGSAIAPAGRVDPGADKAARVKSVAARFEGVFVEQLFKAMRDTVPQDGELTGGAGEELFTALLDEHVASKAPEQWHRGLGSAIVSRLTTATPAVDAGGSAVDTQVRPHPPERDVP